MHNKGQGTKMVVLAKDTELSLRLFWVQYLVRSACGFFCSQPETFNTAKGES
jgi:hypothetical protein